MEPIKPNVSTCPETAAMIFSTPKFVKDQKKLEAENAMLKDLLGKLVAAQSNAVKAKLPQELLDLAGD